MTKTLAALFYKKMKTPKVTTIKLHKQSQLLELAFADGLQAQLSAEFLRVHSPSAEVQGHGQPVLVAGKQNVKILAIKAVGHYAVRLIFSDGHDSGIYSWNWLHRLSSSQADLWLNYQQKLAQHKAQEALQIPVHVQFGKD